MINQLILSAILVSTPVKIPNSDITYSEKYARPNAMSKDSFRKLLKHVAKDRELSFSTEELNSATWIIWKESEGRPWVKNPRSSAFGLPQALKQTYNNYGYGKHYGKNLPYQQVSLFIDYVKDRYGSFSKAVQFHKRKGYY
jgi:hypothetical protein